MVDSILAWLSFALALYIFVSAADDAWIDLLWLRRLLRRTPLTPPPPPRRNPRIAILIPCWHEHEVIGPMVERNVSSIRYPSYSIFIGAYANDPATQDAVRTLSRRFPQVHLSVVPHDGPTCKSDCLNWVYQAVLADEESSGRTHDIYVLHDAEDLVHPHALSEIAAWATLYDMIQVPVLPLPTPFTHFTHGVYCDDFAESQTKDLQTRVEAGAFLPGCGVGTALTREAMDSLAWMFGNRVFSPDHLTEDYDLGLRAHELGLRQIFLPLHRLTGSWLATREYFPHTQAAAVRQRARWITGNSLQAWERAGWRGPWRQRYFFWRDRKGLWGNPLSLLCNFLFLAGLALWAAGRPLPIASGLRPLLAINLFFLLARLVVRAIVTGRIYGCIFALGVPLRMLWGNWINTRATLRALATFWRARLAGRPLVWVKTAHLYPSRAGWMPDRPRLGAVLAANGYLDPRQVEDAEASKPPGMLLGQWLVRLELITERQLYEALSLQQGIPRAFVSPHDINPQAARALPKHLLKRWRLLPYRIAEGGLYVASTEPANEQMQQALQGFTRLEIRLHLISPDEFDRLTAPWL